MQPYFRLKKAKTCFFYEMTSIIVIKALNDYYIDHFIYEVKNMAKQIKQIKQAQRQRVYSRYAKEAVLLLGMQIRQARKQRHLSEQELADRGGISRATLQKIENGHKGSAIGLVFEVAAVLGLHLFDQDRSGILKHIEQTKNLLTLLPKRTYSKTKQVDDDF